LPPFGAMRAAKMAMTLAIANNAQHVRVCIGYGNRSSLLAADGSGKENHQLSLLPSADVDRDGISEVSPTERGLFESTLVSVSVSTRRKGGFYSSVVASKNSVPDSGVRDRFDDWVGGWQFGQSYETANPGADSR
jgi:hypothetical protein